MQTNRKHILSGILITAWLAAPPTANASGIAAGLCAISDSVILGSIGRAIATIGVIIIGIMATLGRVTWTQAMLVATGIAVIFGSASLAAMLSLGDGRDCPAGTGLPQGGGTPGCVQLGQPGAGQWCPPGVTPPG